MTIDKPQRDPERPILIAGLGSIGRRHLHNLQARLGGAPAGLAPQGELQVKLQRPPGHGGSGVILTLIQPLDYLYRVFGKIARVHASPRTVPCLETRVDNDLTVICSEFVLEVLGSILFAKKSNDNSRKFRCLL